jgi:hypothetical protein
MNRAILSTAVGASAAILLQLSVATHAAGSDPSTLLVKPGETIPVTVIPKDVFLRVSNDPQEILWERVPEYEVQLVPAPFVHASTELRREHVGEPIPLFFSVACDRERLYLKLR